MASGKVNPVDVLRTFHFLAEFIFITPTCVTRAEELKTTYKDLRGLDAVFGQLMSFVRLFRAWCSAERPNTIDKLAEVVEFEVVKDVVSLASKVKTAITQIETHLDELERLREESKSAWLTYPDSAASAISSISTIASQVVKECVQLRNMTMSGYDPFDRDGELERFKKMFEVARKSMKALLKHIPFDETRRVWEDLQEAYDYWGCGAFEEPCPLDLFFALLRPDGNVLKEVMIQAHAKILFFIEVEIEDLLSTLSGADRRQLEDHQYQIRKILGWNDLFRYSINLWYDRMLRKVVQDDSYDPPSNDADLPPGFASASLDDDPTPAEGVQLGFELLGSVASDLTKYEIQVWRENAACQRARLPIAEKIRRVLDPERYGRISWSWSF